MNSNEMKQFGATLAAIFEMYGKPAPSDMVIMLWSNALKQYSLQEVSVGLSRHVQDADSGQYMPKPADIVRLISGTTSDLSALAWSKVDKAVRAIGAYEDVVFDDAVIHAVIADMGGWVRMCTDHDDESWVFAKQEFERRYRAYASKRQSFDYPRQLAGIANARNAIEAARDPKFKKYIKPPMVIGNKKAALLVYKGGAGQEALEDSRPKRLDLGVLAAGLLPSMG